jgi:FixJ family two-component response regulator
VVVDDDSEIRKALESLLWSANFRVVSFPSAEDALKSGALTDASCLITDIRLPGMQGHELQHRIKNEHPNLPAIMVTGHRDEKTKQGVLSNGAAAFLFKPLDPGDLLRAVNSAIAKSKHNV